MPLMKYVSLVVRILANLIPLGGVLFFQWSLFFIMFLYWLECVIACMFNLLRMSKAAGTPPAPDKRTGDHFLGKPAEEMSLGELILTTSLTYGIFLWVYGWVFYGLFGPADIPAGGFVIPILALLVSYATSYFVDFIGQKEYLKVSPTQVPRELGAMLAPMVCAAVLAAPFRDAFATRIIGLSILVMAKILIELGIMTFPTVSKSDTPAK